MATWSVKPEWKKSIIERNYLYKDGQQFVVETGWRWGEFTVETEDDNPPDIEAGVNIYDCGYESELVETNDGCWKEHDYDDVDDETREWLRFFEEGNSWLDLEEHGWSQGECEMIIDCDLIIEKLNEHGEPTGEIVGAHTTNQWPSPDSDFVETAKWPFDKPQEKTKEALKLEPTAKWPFDNAKEGDK